MPPDQMIWLEIDDFTPGIVNNSNLAQPITDPVPGKQSGQAQSAVGCIALAQGGLAPLPGLTTLQPIHTHPAITTSYTGMVNGLFVIGPVSQGAGTAPDLDTVMWGQLSWDNSSAWVFTLAGTQYLNGSPIGSVTTFESLTQTDAHSQAYTLTGDTTAANQTPSSVGVPTLAIGFWWRAAWGAGNPYVWLFPDPTNTSSGAPYQLSNALLADAITHQNRVIALTNSQSDDGLGGYIDANELFNYTDPPNGLSLGSQNEAFIQEHMYGIGAWGSINASELFMVKHTGGAFYISGDLNNPTVIRLPGVTPTYGVMSRGADTPLGFVYASGNHGLLAWSGGQNAQKISNQLADNFFVNTSIPNAFLPVAHGWTVDICRWGDWIVTTNDYLFDTQTGGWWKLNPSATGQPHLYVQPSTIGQVLYAAVPSISHTQTTVIDIYDRNLPSNTWTWTSYPMRLTQGSKDRNYSVQEVVIRAQGAGTIAVTLTGTAGSSTALSPSNTATFTTTTRPQMFELHAGVQAQDVTISITATGSGGGAAPILYSIAIGYMEQNPVSGS